MYSQEEVTVLWMEVWIYYNYCSQSSTCFRRTAFAIFADFSQFQVEYLEWISLSSSSISSFSRSLLLFSSSYLSLLTQAYIIFALKPWISLYIDPNLRFSSYYMCCIMISLSLSYFSFSTLYFSTLFQSLLTSCCLHRTSSSSSFLFALSSLRSSSICLANLLNCLSSSSFPAMILPISALSSLPLYFILCSCSIFIDPVRFTGVSRPWSNPLNRFQILASVRRCCFCLGESSCVSRLGVEQMSSQERQLIFFSEPDRQWMV